MTKTECNASFTIIGAGEPNFDGLDANPYRSAKQRQEWEVKALMEKIQPDLISLDPTELAQVDQATWEQRHQDRVEVLVSVLKQLCIYNYLRCISVYFYIRYSRLNIIATHLKACFIFFLFFLSQGFDPLAKEKFVPKYKKKGRSSAGAIERRKKQVAHEEQRVSSPS